MLRRAAELLLSVGDRPRRRRPYAQVDELLGADAGDAADRGRVESHRCPRRPADAIVAPDYTGSDQGWPPTLRELLAFYEWQASARPDWRIYVQEAVTVGNCVVVRAEAAGTVKEDERGRPLGAPTARHVEWLAAYWVDDRRISRIRALALAPRID